ncbi:MAG TPA: ROK family protein [Ferruginibacter sp.]|nr:ROK family protein [Ferruginibacter sp.]
MLDKQTVYKKQIQKHLYFGGELSCADLSELTKRSIPLTAKIINELIEEGSVVETGLANSTGGRRPQMYSLKSDITYIVAVSMDQLVTRIAILDMQNNYVVPIENFELTLAHNPQALYQLLDLLKKYIAKSGISKEKIIGVGIGMPGFVDVKKSINTPYLKPAKGNIVSELETELNIPVFIDNDSSLVALAELKFGKARNTKNTMVINIGWGVGLGMILNGELFRGHNGFAGEFSHIPIFTNNKICGCGKSGCLETETSLLVIIEKALKGIKEGKSTSLKNIHPEHPEEAAHQILEAALNGDSFSIDLISEIGYNIGRGVAILIHILNPELIVLSGRGSIAGRLWRAPIQQAINKLCIPKIAEDTYIEISHLNYQAEIIGTACLVMDQIDKRKFLLTHEKNLIS